MNWFIENWPLMVAALAIIVVAIIFVYHFIKMPKSKQLAKISEWLIWAVAEAEKALGSGTGKLKLRYVYDMFMTKFPIAAKYLSFDKFGFLVDAALEKFNEILKTNKQVQDYVNTSTPTAVIVEEKKEVSE